MAEHEIIKHTKRAFKISRDPHKSWKEKGGEIVLDILIIVFAVSLSLYLHERAEKKHERHIEEAFLQGLKLDLQRDLKELAGDSTTYARVQSGFRYFLQAGYNQTPFSKDSAAKYNGILFNTTDLQANDSRFQGMKASGQLHVIEDGELLNDILELYQEKIPGVLMVTNGFTRFKTERLGPYLDTHFFPGSNNNSNRESVIRDPEFLNYMRRAGHVNEIIGRYHEVMDQCRLIIQKIEQKYANH